MAKAKTSRMLPGYERKKQFAEDNVFARGFPSYSDPMVARGFVFQFEKHTGDGYLRTKNSVIRCRWWKRKIPPNVVLGAKIMVVGNLLTTALGQCFWLHDCTVIKNDVSYKEFKKEFDSLLRGRILHVGEYIEKED